MTQGHLSYVFNMVFQMSLLNFFTVAKFPRLQSSPCIVLSGPNDLAASKHEDTTGHCTTLPNTPGNKLEKQTLNYKLIFVLVVEILKDTARYAG